MGSWKSQVDIDFYVDLLVNVLADAYQSYPDLPSREAKRDEFTIRSRVAFEGLEFLTKTLPKLGKALLVGLETGQLIVPPEFSRKSKGGRRWNIPELFSGLFLTIFNREGTLDPSDRPAVGELRQLCQLCYKLETPTSENQAEACEQKYVRIENEIGDQPQAAMQDFLPVVRRARWLLRNLFRGFNPSEVVPHHGPGAVADPGVRGRGKYHVRFYSPSLDQLYPYSSYATGGVHTQNIDDLLEPYTLSREIPPAKVVMVPKDSRGPRVISCEPALLQFMQQGLARKIVGLVESHPLTRASVHFTDQQPNRHAALQSSRDGRMATIDLADASDRVSCNLVEMLFPEQLLPYLRATRSQVSRLPSGRLVRLKKFAPMGSALCFPIEALTFWALTRATLETVSRIPRLSARRCLVYGDDIIVDTEHVDAVITVLEAFGLSVNRDKCFARGKFRESCGCDAYDYVDVTPIKLRALVKRGRNRCLGDVYRLSKNAQGLFDRGYWRAAEGVWQYCESRIGVLPTTGPAFAGISRTSAILPPVSSNLRRTRWNQALQRLEVRTIVLKARKSVSLFPSSIARLMHNLIEGVHEPYDDCVAVPHSAKPKAVWAAIL